MFEGREADIYNDLLLDRYLSSLDQEEENIEEDEE